MARGPRRGALEVVLNDLYEPRLLDTVLTALRQPFRIVESIVGVDAWCDRCIIGERLADRETAAFWFGAHAVKHHGAADADTIDWLP